VREHEVGDHVDEAGNDRGRRDHQHASGGQRPEAVAETGDRPSFGQHEGRAARHAHHTESGDERRQPAERDQSAVDETARQPHGQRQGDRGRHADTGLQRASEDNAGDREYRADREIDAA
jgi:hypothetical protein